MPSLLSLGSLTVFAALVAMQCWGTSAVSVAVPPASKLLSDDTLLMITVPDFAAARVLHRRTPQTRLWHDVAMKAFTERFTEKMTEQLIVPLERELDVRWSECAALPQGQMTFALVKNEGPGDTGPPTAWLFLFDARDKSPSLTKTLGGLKKKWVDSGKALRSERIRDREFTVLVAAAKDVPKSVKEVFSPPRTFLDPTGGNKPPVPVEPSPEAVKAAAVKREFYVGQVDSLLIVATAARPIEKVLARLGGAQVPTLDEVPPFAANRDTVFRDAAFFGWINPKPFLETVGRQFGDLPNPPEFTNAAPENLFFLSFGTARVLSALGAGSLKSVAFSLRQSDEGALFQLFGSAPETERQGLFKIVARESTESGPPPYVPANALSFWRWRFTGTRACTTLKESLDVLSPQLAGTLKWLVDSANEAARQKDPDSDLREAIASSLGDDIIGFQKAPASGVTDPEAVPSLYLLSSPRPELLVSALRALFVLLPQPDPALAEREFLGRKIFAAPLPVLPGSEPPKGGLRTLYYAASSNDVVLSTDVAMLEEHLRGQDARMKSLREAPGFAEAAERVVGPGASWFSYHNPDEATRLAFENLKKDTNYSSAFSVLLPLPNGLGILGGGLDLRGWMDLSLLPPFEQVARYFSFTVCAMSATTDGISIKYFAPTPPQLKRQP